MALSETKPDPQSTLQQVLHYQPPAENPFQTLRLPEIEPLENLQHRLLCEFNNLACRVDIAARQTELTSLLTQHNTLLQQYEALQYLTNITNVEHNKVMLGIGTVIRVEQLYALHIYQLMLQGDFSRAEYKLVTLIKQQRRFLNNAAPGLRRALVITNISQYYLPLALELSQRSASLQRGLAEALQPLSLRELTGIASKQYEFLQMFELVRHMERGAVDLEFPSLGYKLLYKPNLTANSLYQLHDLDEIAQINSKPSWYNFSNARTNDDIDVSSLSFKLSHYRNLVGGTVISTMTPVYYNFNEQVFHVDLKLHLLKPLLKSVVNQQQLSDNSFSLNPFNNTSVVNKNGQWCYVLEQDICLAAE